MLYNNFKEMDREDKAIMAGYLTAELGLMYSVAMWTLGHITGDHSFSQLGHVACTATGGLFITSCLSEFYKLIRDQRWKSDKSAQSLEQTL